MTSTTTNELTAVSTPANPLIQSGLAGSSDPIPSAADHAVHEQTNEVTVGQEDSTPVEIHQNANLRFESDKGRTSTAVEGSYTGVSRLIGHDRGTIEQFLARNVPILSGVWAHGTPLNVNVNPWSTLLNNPALKRKLDNYHLFRASIVIEVTYNATPFHMGLLHCIYDPVPQNRMLPSTTEALLCTYSQRPGTRRNPLNIARGQTFSLRIPFVSANEFIDVSRFYAGTDFDWNQNMALFRLMSLENLATANAELVDVSYKVLAHFEDVEICIPAVQASAEMDVPNNQSTWRERLSNIKLSGVSSAIASGMGYLETVPELAPLVVPGQLVFGTAAEVLKHFGYSKPLIAQDNTIIRPEPFGPLASTVGGDTATLLALDPQQQVTVDPSTMNLGAVDQMSFKHMASTWSMMGSFTWDNLDVEDARLVDVGVSPCTTIPATTPSALTSTFFVAAPFDRWSGTLCYKIILNTSMYQSGRLALIYSPDGSINSVDSTNVTYMEYIDIRERYEIEFSISWSQGVAYLHTRSSDGSMVAPLGIIYNSALMNGFWSLRVVNPLKAPAPASTVTGQIFIAAGDDFEVAMPSDQFLYEWFTPQLASAEVEAPMSQLEKLALLAVPVSAIIPLSGVPDVEKTQSKPLVYFGEKIVSARTLAKRYTLCYRNLENIAAAVADVEQVLTMDLGFWPTAPTNTATLEHNSYIDWISHAFYGVRGSLRWKVSTQVPNDLGGYITAQRGAGIGAAGTGTFTAQSRTDITQRAVGFKGAHATHMVSNPVIEVASPFYSRFKCALLDQAVPVAPFDNREDEFQLMNIVVDNHISPFPTTTTSEVAVYVWVAGGDDFDCIWYLGAPAYSFVP